MLPDDTSAVLQSLLETAPPVRVRGPHATSGAYLIGKYVTGRNLDTTVILCPDQETASDLLLDLETLAPFFSGKLPSARLFPTWEQSPYSPIALSIRTRLDRLDVLSSLVFESSPKIIVTTIAAACQATLPKSIFQSSSFMIRTEKAIESRESLIKRLVNMGYQRTDPVEDEGTFAIRGEIIDIFPPNLPRPVRIELFDDLVEKIREFDPKNQRAITSPNSNLNSCQIPPAREVFFWNDEICARLRENLKNRADSLGIPRIVRDPVLEMVRNRQHPDHMDAWASFAFTTPSTLWDYLPLDHSVIWVDEFSCLQNWNDFSTQKKEQEIKTSTDSHLILPPVESIYAWNSALSKSIESQALLFLDRIELSTVRSIEQNQVSILAAPAPSTFKGQGTFKQWLQDGFFIAVFATTQSQLERMRYILELKDLPCFITAGAPPKRNVINLYVGSVSESFQWISEGLIVLTEAEILGTDGKKGRKNRASRRDPKTSAAAEWSGLHALSDLNIGDNIVHRDHGIGKYLGLARLDLLGAATDFLQIEYYNKDKLYLPVYRLNVVQKYAGTRPDTELDRLGSSQFQKTKEKVRNSVKTLAIDLINLYAKRKIQSGIQFSSEDSDYSEFEAKFPFEETPDQLKAIQAILEDLKSGKTMDRLVCGDVGYGKTEVAIRAAYRAVMNGKQVAVLVPTTLLAQQHEQSFKLRMKDYPFNIESISRFKSPKENRLILEGVTKGKIDIVIGTHRLLSKDVKFSDLGMIIIDEEHRFGVEHKERLKTLRTNTHVLTLTATPIPRTLHMALSGLRDISLINTPPIDRLPIRTYVARYDEEMIRKAIESELSRGGQVFYLHNRVQTIMKATARVQELVPSAKVLAAHGQMDERDLDHAMIEFYSKRANVLVCTSIIESGIDVPSANTLIIERADTFGLSQLYQIRGRVGRGQDRAYAYLLIPAETDVTEDAKKRLEVIQKFVELGSGFNIASHDLEIRGGGEVLGAQQSGNIAAVGFDLYTELLEEAIRELQGSPFDEDQTAQKEPEIKAPFPAFLGEDYVPDVHQRLSIYRRLSAAPSEDQIRMIEEELRDRFGSLTVEAMNLMWIIRIKLLLKNAGVDSLTVGPEKISFQITASGPRDSISVDKAITLTTQDPHRFQLRPDSKFIVKTSTLSLRDLFFEIEKILNSLTSKP